MILSLKTKLGVYIVSMLAFLGMTTAVVTYSIAQQPQPLSGDRRAIEGTWKLVGGGSDGKPATEAEMLAGPQIVITDKEFNVLVQGQVAQRSSYSIDPQQEPKKFDLIANNPDGGRGPDQILGIYDLSGDRLRITLQRNTAGERPTKVGNGPGLQFWELQRAGAAVAMAPTLWKTQLKNPADVAAIEDLERQVVAAISRGHADDLAALFPTREQYLQFLEGNSGSIYYERSMSLWDAMRGSGYIDRLKNVTFVRLKEQSGLVLKLEKGFAFSGGFGVVKTPALKVEGLVAVVRVDDKEREINLGSVIKIGDNKWRVDSVPTLTK